MGSGNNFYLKVIHYLSSRLIKYTPEHFTVRINTNRPTPNRIKLKPNQTVTEVFQTEPDRTARLYQFSNPDQTEPVLLLKFLTQTVWTGTLLILVCVTVLDLII